MPAFSPMRSACLYREKLFVNLFRSISAARHSAAVLYMEWPIITYLQDESMACPLGEDRLIIGALGRDDMDERVLCNKP